MIHYIDNFLPQDQFLALKARVDGRFNTGDTSYLYEGSEEPVRITHHDHTGDWVEGCNFLGRECIPALDKMVATLEELGVTELLNWSIWFQYIINTMTLPPHQDQGLRSSDKEHTYTAILYTSDWQPGWGGEFIVGEPTYTEEDYKMMKEQKVFPRAKGMKNLTHVVEPKPNRMLIWSREEWHAVQKVTNPDPDYVRSFFGSGWSSVSNPVGSMQERLDRGQGQGSGITTANYGKQSNTINRSEGGGFGS